MTPEDAIDYINIMLGDGCMWDGFTQDGKEAFMESLEMGIQSLEKQIGKKPKKLSYEPLIKHGWEYECPECGKAIGLNSVGFHFTDEDPFCPSCGTKIDWGEEE